MAERKKVMAKPISVKTLYEKCSKKIPTSLRFYADDSRFLPDYNVNTGNATLVANMPVDITGEAKVQMPHRTTIMIDCGITLWVPHGYRLTVNIDPDLARKGVIVDSNPFLIPAVVIGIAPNSVRVGVIVTNVGKEIIVIKRFDKFAHLRVDPICDMKWEMTGKSEIV